MLQLDRAEQVAVRKEHLGAPEEQAAVLLQRVAELAEDASLCFGREVHQGVAAGEQIEPRDGRISQQVVPPEDEHPAEARPEEVAASLGLEVPGPQILGHALELLQRVPLSGVEERVLVDVGRVDLDALHEALRPHGLGEGHGDRIGLLA